MRIAIIGYGRMGKMIEEIALAKGHIIGLIVDVENQSDLNAKNLSGHEVAIEFTTPGAAYKNISTCFDARIPVVSGTTGWFQKMDKMIARCIEENQSFVYASNFSVGVNILFNINRQLAELMNHFEQYKTKIEEIHHIKKLDSPSGTAITLANNILEKIKRFEKWELTKGNSPDEILPVHSIRAGNITGIHEISYESDFDTISLRHSAKNRKGFALGAILAAEFINNNTGFYTMQDVLGLK